MVNFPVHVWLILYVQFVSFYLPGYLMKVEIIEVRKTVFFTCFNSSSARCSIHCDIKKFMMGIFSIKWYIGVESRRHRIGIIGTCTHRCT